ncbi:hypothetical protein D9756_008361 [Leucocoprinus leucothites]|uniref:F-box domain-containing protein n=1 Tax=Leucocoprinus leucothites TaxID=201217 RepID=A0A8H5D057_9AGAR|nr:hypothetical protein D9756_008361 [Leucoagaricus leucothites]
MSLFSPWNLYRWFISSHLARQNIPRDLCCPRHVNAFLSLPNELLVDVLARLDYSSIFAVRMTCKKLYQITLSPHLWFGVIGRLQLECGIVPPEEGMSKYSAKGLEDWVSRRSMAYAALNSQKLAQPHVRLIDLKTRDIDNLVIPEPYLLPGGRWFLLAHSTSRMLVYDLDSVAPIRKCLFNPLDFDKKLVSEYVRYAFWFDHSSPRFSFYVAGNAFDADNARSFIYAVQLSGHGANATLTASFVAAFHSSSRKDWYLGRFALNKRYYIEVRGDPNDSKVQSILAYEFQHAPGSGGYCSIKPAAQTCFVGDRICLAAFIYDDVLAICTTRDALRLYDIVDSGSATSRTSPTTFKLLHTVPFCFNFYSDIRWSPLESYMVAITREGEFKGLRIPHDRSEPPTVLELGRQEKFWNKMTGWKLDTSFSISQSAYDAPMEITCHPWINVRGDPPSLNCLVPPLDGFRVPYLGMRSKIIGFSEDLGRFVIYNDGSHTSVVVVDFTATHYLHK